MRKVYLLIFTAVLTTNFVHAQIPKGSTWLGGSLGFYHSEDNTYSDEIAKYSSLSINPSIGKAIKDNTVLGLGVRYLRQKSEHMNNYHERTANYYTLEVFGRKYGQIFRS